MSADPYRPPRRDLDPVEPPRGGSALVGAGGAMASAAGLLMLASSWQLLTMLHFSEAWMEAWVAAIGLCGLVALPSGAGFTQARRWALMPTVLSTGVGALLTAAWVGTALLLGGFTLVSFVGAGVAGGAALLTGIGLGTARQVVEARERLYTHLED